MCGYSFASSIKNQKSQDMKDQNQAVGYTLTAGKFQWDIAPGKTITAWGFNNQIPAPVLKAKGGDTHKSQK